MLVRKAYDKLLAWKSSTGRTALLVTGARQVGKSYLIEQFAQNEFDRYVRFDLIEQRDVLSAVSKCESSDELFMTLSAFGGPNFIPGDTCVIIDEVQECKEIVTFIKYLLKYEGFEFILSGSLLGIELRSVRSLPVGYMSVLEMYPLDFEEFCWSQGLANSLLQNARDSIDQRRPVFQPLHQRLLDLFHRYLIVGGMPAAVNMFKQTSNLAQTKAVQDDVVRLYRADISKYASKGKLVIREIYDQLPAQLDSQSKRFNFSTLAPKGSFARYQEEFLWMIDAGVALAVTNVTEPRHPLKLAESRSFFKLFANDVGLLCGMCGMDVVKGIVSDNLCVNYGAIYENAVAQELHAHGHELHFYRNKKIGEFDFVIENGLGKVLPLEVKSGKDYKRHSALNNALKTPNWAIDEAVVLCEENVEADGQIVYLPVYAVMWF